MPQTEIRLYRDDDGSTPFLEWCQDLKTRDPKAYVKCLQRIQALSQLGNELRRPIADILRNGIYELRAKRGRVNYRILYFFSGKNVVVISHGLTKESDVPDLDIDLAIERKNRVKRNESKYTAEWEE